MQSALVGSLPDDRLSPRGLAQLIDISVVQAHHTEADAREVARIAVEHDFIAVHALPNYVPLLRQLVPAGGLTLVGGPVGFPSGGSTIAIKVAEAIGLADAGAEELDLMINVGRLRSADMGYVISEIRAVAEAVAPVPLKVILEVGLLSELEIARGAEAVVEGGGAFVKTGTGWLVGGTTAAQIGVIARAVQGRVAIKASGGIRTLDTVAEMIRLGVTRFGISTRHAVALVEACAREPGGQLSLVADASR